MDFTHDTIDLYKKVWILDEIHCSITVQLRMIEDLLVQIRVDLFVQIREDSFVFSYVIRFCMWIDT